jgi:hypothetical protein
MKAQTANTYQKFWETYNQGKPAYKCGILKYQLWTINSMEQDSWQANISFIPL